MLPIEKYIDAIENKDYEGLGNLFTRDGHYCDYCANGTPQHDYHLYGKEAISMFFRNKFLCRQYSILEPTVLSPSQAEFIACFGGYHVMAIVTLYQVERSYTEECEGPYTSHCRVDSSTCCQNGLHRHKVGVERKHHQCIGCHADCCH